MPALFRVTHRDTECICSMKECRSRFDTRCELRATPRFNSIKNFRAPWRFSMLPSDLDIWMPRMDGLAEGTGVLHVLDVLN